MHTWLALAGSGELGKGMLLHFKFKNTAALMCVLFTHLAAAEEKHSNKLFILQQFHALHTSETSQPNSFNVKWDVDGQHPIYPRN